MNIIHRGNWEPQKYQLTCNRCGSIWECDELEVYTASECGETYIICNCPVCGKDVMYIMEFENRCMGNTKVVDK